MNLLLRGVVYGCGCGCGCESSLLTSRSSPPPTAACTLRLGAAVTGVWSHHGSAHVSTHDTIMCRKLFYKVVKLHYLV